jgi:DNA polymerase-3 subunit gamma/tau
VRLLDLVSAALEATANGAQARIQLELVLIKAAAPEVDPSTTALLARIERLEAALAGGGGAAQAGVSPTPAPALPTPAPASPTPTPAPVSPAPVAPSALAHPAPPATGATAPPVGPAPPAGPAPPVAPAPPTSPATTAAAPVPAVPAPAPGGPPELQTVAACWPAVIELLISQENQMLAYALADARPVSLQDQDLTIAFPSDKAFHKRKAEQDDYRRATAEALRSIIGTPLALRYELRDEPDLSQPAAAVGVAQEELVRRLVEEFDAHEVLDPDEET